MVNAKNNDLMHNYNIAQTFDILNIVIYNQFNFF